VRVDSQLDSFAPVQLENTRPSVLFNTIRFSAGAGIAATPDSFEDTGDRVGPEVRGNRLTGNSVNGLFVKIATQFGTPLDRLDVPARFKSNDIVYVIQENLVINGGAGGYEVVGGVERARQTGRLTIDPGVIVKLQGSRIELERGIAQLVAEGTAGKSVIFTSLGDNRYGAGGTFDTNGNVPDKFDALGRAVGTLTVGDPDFTSWITDNFANGQVPVDKRGPNDDPDSDGIPNLVEYAIAYQDPTVPNPTIGSFTTTSLSFSKRSGTSGLTYAIQESTDLGIADDWDEVTGINYTNHSSSISYSFNAGTPAKNFLRLQVLSN
jgi:hypothetical protein